MKSIVSKDWKEAGEPHFKITPKRIMVDGEYVICQVHGQRWENDSGEHVFDMYRYREGQFLEYWDVQMEIPASAKLTHGNGVF